MWVLGARVNFQFIEHFRRELVLRQHAPNGFADDELWAAIAAMFGRLGSQTVVAGVPVVFLGLPLLAGKLDFVRVHHDDKIATFDVRRVRRAMLAHQYHRDIAGQASDNFVGRIYNPPLGFQLTSLGHVGFRFLRSLRRRHGSISPYGIPQLGSSSKGGNHEFITFSVDPQGRELTVQSDSYRGLLIRLSPARSAPKPAHPALPMLPERHFLCHNFAAQLY